VPDARVEMKSDELSSRDPAHLSGGEKIVMLYSLHPPSLVRSHENTKDNVELPVQSFTVGAMDEHILQKEKVRRDAIQSEFFSELANHRTLNVFLLTHVPARERPVRAAVPFAVDERHLIAVGHHATHAYFHVVCPRMC